MAEPIEMSFELWTWVGPRKLVLDGPLKFAGVPQTRQQTSAVSRPKFTILLRHVREVSAFNIFSDC